MLSHRGMQTKAEILQAAKKLFMQKGYVAVTMSDICEATELSRGGLYRHFSSTKDIFLELLRSDRNCWEEETVKAMAGEVSASKILEYYFEHISRVIFEGDGRFSLAIYEYWRTEQDEDASLSKRYVRTVDMMERVLQYGQSCGEFGVFDAYAEAEHIVIFIDGLKMAAVGLALSPATVKRQLDKLLSRLTMEGAWV